MPHKSRSGRPPYKVAGRTAVEQRSWAGLAAIWVFMAVPVAPWWAGADPGTPLRLVVLGAGLASVLLWVLKNQPRNRLAPPLAWAGLAGLAVVAVGALASGTPWLGLLGRYPRYEGLPMLAAYLAVFTAGAWLCGGEAGSRRGHLLTALAVLQGVLATWALAEVIADPTDRVTTAVGNASDLGVIGVVGFAVLAWHAIRDWHWLFWAGASSSALVVALSASRGAWLGLGVVVSASLVLLLVRQGASPKRLRRTVRQAWPAGLIVLGVVAVVSLNPMTRSRGLGSSPLGEQTVSGRLMLWRETLRLWSDNPWLGVGPSGFVDGIVGYHTAEWASTIGPDSPPDSPHNVILQVMASCGVAGLVVALVFAGALAGVLWRARRDEWSVAAFLALLGASACYGFHFTSLWNVVPLLLIVGGACGDKPGTVGKSKSTQSGKTGRAGSTQPGKAGRAWRDGGNWLVGVAAVLAVMMGGQAMVAEAMLARSTDLIQSGQPQGLALAEQAVRLKPQDADMAWRTGHALTVLAGRGQVPAEAAVDILTRACRRLPGSVECLNDLALADLRAGSPDQAEAVLQQSLSRDPTNMETVLLTGQARDALGDPVGAEAAFLKAADLRPTSPAPWQNLAALYTGLGRHADATMAQKRADELS